MPLLAEGQTLTIGNDVQTFATLAVNIVAMLTGNAELHVTDSGDPILGCTIHLNSRDASGSPSRTSCPRRKMARFSAVTVE